MVTVKQTFYREDENSLYIPFSPDPAFVELCRDYEEQGFKSIPKIVCYYADGSAKDEQGNYLRGTTPWVKFVRTAEFSSMEVFKQFDSHPLTVQSIVDIEEYFKLHRMSWTIEVLE